jgi:transforming growth factor-beta-induced protein
MKSLRALTLPFLISAALAVAACSSTAPVAQEVQPAAAPAEEVVAEANDIVDIAVADGRFETLVAALTAADLVGTLQGEGPFTVFAPTDDAFAALPEGTVEALLEDIPALTDVLLYHVVPGNVMAADVVALDAANTVQGQAVAITVDGDSVMVNDSQVVITDIEAANGVIHVIDAVLIPSAEGEAMEDGMEMEQTIVDIAVADGRFETLVAALTAADLAGTLQGEGPFTVFAPTDDAFAALPEGTVEALLEDIPALTDVLLYHVVPGNVMAADVVALDAANTVQGQAVAITVDGDSVMVNDSQVVITDIEAANGVIHVIDAVLIPSAEGEAMEDGMEMEQTIVDIAVADGRFETLVAALTAADLAGTLQGEGPFTVFAPTDDAFAALPEGTVEALLEDIPALTDILLYHVVPGNVMAADVVALDAANTVQGQAVAITVDGDSVMVNDSQVVITDIEAANGVIHVIDAVLIPQS